MFKLYIVIHWGSLLLSMPFFSIMFSGMARNVQFYCERYGVRIQEVLSFFSEQRRLLLDEDVIRRADIIRELTDS